MRSFSFMNIKKTKTHYKRKKLHWHNRLFNKLIDYRNMHNR